MTTALLGISTTAHWTFKCLAGQETSRHVLILSGCVMAVEAVELAMALWSSCSTERQAVL